MRRFIEEIRVETPEIAEKIIAALETKSEDKRDPVYEVDMYENGKYDPLSNKLDSQHFCFLKIFVREDITS